VRACKRGAAGPLVNTQSCRTHQQPQAQQAALVGLTQLISKRRLFGIMAMGKDNMASPENIRAAMEDAWRDHHHARDQTWRVLQIEAALGAGLVTVDAQFHSIWATVFAGILVILAALSGMLISWHHRKLERRKFIHIINCEDQLGLHKWNLVPLKDRLQEYEQELHTGVDPADMEKVAEIRRKMKLVTEGAVTVPCKMRWWDVFNPWAQNTAIFIMRMHVAILAFGALMIIIRCNKGNV